MMYFTEVTNHLYYVKHNNGARYHEALAHLQTIDACVDVDSIRWEEGEQQHVDVVEGTCGGVTS